MMKIFKSSRHIAFIPLLIFMFTSGAVIFDADNKGTFIDESRGLAFPLQGRNGL